MAACKECGDEILWGVAEGRRVQLEPSVDERGAWEQLPDWRPSDELWIDGEWAIRVRRVDPPSIKVGRVPDRYTEHRCEGQPQDGGQE